MTPTLTIDRVRFDELILLNDHANNADRRARATRMRARAYPGEDAATLPKPADVAPAIAALCLPGEMRNGEVIRLGDR